MKKRRLPKMIRHHRRGISAIVGAVIVAVIIFVVAVAYFGYEMNQRTSLEQAANQAAQLNHQASQEIINANASLDATGNLNVNITDDSGSTPVEIVDVIVGNVSTNHIIKEYSGLQIPINPGRSYPFDTTIHYNPGNQFWAKVVTSLGTTAMALYPYPIFASNSTGGTSGTGYPRGNLFDIELNFSTFSWYRIVSCTPDNPQESGYCLSPSLGGGNDASTIYTQSTTQPLAFVAQVMDVNPEQKNITLDSLTNFLEFQSCGSSICSYVWFLSSNVTSPNSNGQMMNHLLNNYQLITLNYGVPVTLVFATISNQPHCTTNCYPNPTYAPVPSYNPRTGVAANLIFAQGWEGITANQPVNYGQNLPFTSTLYITPQITLSPTVGPVGTNVTVSGSSFTPASAITITYAGTVVATTTSSLSGTFSTTFIVPQSTGTNTVTATDSNGNSASANFGVSDFAIATSSTLLTAEMGGPSVTDTVTVTSLNGFTGSVSLSYSISPSSGLSATLSPTSVPLGTSGTSTLSVTASAFGEYVVTITGTSGLVTHSVNVTVFVTSLLLSPTSGNPGTVITLTGGSYVPGAAYSYCLSTSSTSVSCVPGSSSTFTATSTGGIPTGTTLTVPSGAPTGTQYVIVNKTTINSFASFEVQDFSISSTPTVASVQPGIAASFTITLSSLDNFAGSVTLNALSSPACSSCSSFTVNPVTLSAGGQSSATLQFTSSSTGTYNITVTGSYGGDVHSINVTVNVQLSSSTSLSCTPTPLQSGTSTTCTASVSGINPTGTVSFSQTNGGTGASFNTTSCTLVSGSCGVTYSQSAPGTVTINATYGGDSNNIGSTSPTVSVTFYPNIVLSSAQGPAGTGVTVTGSGFSPNTAINTFTFNGVTPTTQTCTSQTTSSTGTFSCTFTVPTSSTGSYSVTVSGSDIGSVPSDTASANFAVTTASLSVTPSSCTSGSGGNCGGTTFTLTGSGYAQSETYGYCLSASQTSVSCVSGTANSFTSTSSGAIPTAVTIQGNSAWTAGTYYVAVYDPITNTIIATSTFTIA